MSMSGRHGRRWSHAVAGLHRRASSSMQRWWPIESMRLPGMAGATWRSAKAIS